METNTATDSLSRNLRALMKRHNLSSGEAVKRRTGVSKAEVNNLLSGKHSATLKTLALLADGFKVPVWLLLHEHGAAIAYNKELSKCLSTLLTLSPSSRDLVCRVADAQLLVESPGNLAYTLV